MEAGQTASEGGAGFCALAGDLGVSEGGRSVGNQRPGVKASTAIWVLMETTPSQTTAMLEYYMVFIGSPGMRRHHPRGEHPSSLGNSPEKRGINFRRRFEKNYRRNGNRKTNTLSGTKLQ